MLPATILRLMSQLPSCRERQQVTAFVEEAVSAGSECLGNCLYISGVPGTGKVRAHVTIFDRYEGNRFNMWYESIVSLTQSTVAPHAVLAAMGVVSMRRMVSFSERTFQLLGKDVFPSSLLVAAAAIAFPPSLLELPGRLF